MDFFVTCPTVSFRRARSHNRNPPIGGLVNLHKLIVLYPVCVYLLKFIKVCKKTVLKLTLSEHIAKSREAVAANKAKGNRHAELLATMYAQPSRFIEEILQNTEDAYSRKKSAEPLKMIRFKLFENRIEIHHNGKDFDEADLMSITTFANTTKKNNSEVNLIGKFGIGFKSVFSVTDLPEIHCEQYHYSIADYEVLIDAGKKNPDNGFNTLIILPFKKKQENELHEAVYNGLAEINDYYLLFLKQLNCIEIYNDNALLTRLERSRTIKNTRVHLVNIRKTFYREPSTTVDSNFIVFSGNHSSKKQQAELAFKYTEADGKFRVQPVHDVPLFAYFPTRMHSGLNVVINAPFTTNPLREYIPFDADLAPENLKNLDEAVLLLSKALDVFKHMKLLDLTLISLLPLKKPESIEIKKADDTLVYKNFYEAVLNYFKTKEAIPVGENKYATADEVLLPHNEELATLLDSKDLQKLYQKKQFVNPEICNQLFNEVRTYFSEMMQISTADAGSFGFRVLLNTGILKEKKTDWLKQFYKYIHKNENLWSLQHVSDYYSLRNAPIILTQDHGFLPAFDAGNNPTIFMPDEKKSFLPVIHKKILDDPKCHAFFEDLGINVLDVADDVEFNIIPQFETQSLIFGKKHIKSLEKILEAYVSVPLVRKEKIIGLLKKAPWVYCTTLDSTNKYNLKKPDETYMFSADIIDYFENYDGASVVEPLLFKKLNKKFQGAYSLLLEDVGVQKFPKTKILEEKLVDIDGFGGFLKAVTLKRSKAFIHLLLSLSDEFLTEGLPDFLKNKSWIYTKNKLFEPPGKISKSSISVLYKFTDSEKYRLCHLMGITENAPQSLEPCIDWNPLVSPDEAIPFCNQGIIKSGAVNPGFFSKSNLEFSAPSFTEEQKKDKNSVYSEEDLKKIHLWSCGFIEKMLTKTCPDSNYVIESSENADQVLKKDGRIIKYIFVCGKSDLLNAFPLNVSQLARIIKLFKSAEDTCLYFVNAAGTKNAAFNVLNNPLDFLTRGKLLSGDNVWIKGLF